MTTTAPAETSAHTRRIYTLHGYPPEVIAVAFAKTSRVPDSFDAIAAELNEEISSKFHAKWVVGYGHASVAEHAVLSIAIENVSILAAKVIEDNRLSSFTEQSTRYQPYDEGRFWRPPRLMKSQHGERFVDLCTRLMRAYTEWLDPMMAHLEPMIERQEKWSDKFFQSKVRAAALDVLRYLLPCATQTNLGWTANARVLEHGITKLRSHPLEEMVEIGEILRDVCTERVPTLLKYADPNEYLAETPDLVRPFAEQQMEGAPLDDQWDVQLVHWESDAEDRVIAALLYEHTRSSHSEVMARVKAMPAEERQRLLAAAIEKRGHFDQVTRAWETTSYTFDTLIDYGAWRDLQRHRMATQINQPISTCHGFVVPPQIDAAGLGEGYRALMEEAREVHDAIAADLPHEAPYTVPLAYRKRTLFTMNLRELHHLVQLRSAPQGHLSYRLMANHLLEAVRRVHPTLAAQIRHTPVD